MPNIETKPSIIITAYNQEKYLHQTLQSIRGQEYGEFECIVIDDGSNDRTGEIADTYEQ